MRVLEGAVFLGLAASAHLGLWVASPALQGAGSAGDQGTEVVTVAAASAAQSAMVENWTRPPEVTESIPAAMRPERAETAPQITAPAPDLARPALPAAPQLASPDAPALPQVDDAPPPQPLAKAPSPSQRPKARPDRTVATPKPVASKSPAPSRQKTAAGASKSANAGQGGVAASQSASPAQANALRARWGADIYAAVRRNMAYPRGSRDTGTTKLALTVARNGRLQGAQVVGSSGSAVLDRAALRAVKRAGRFSQAPEGLTQASYSFRLALTFTR